MELARKKVYTTYIFPALAESQRNFWGNAWKKARCFDERTLLFSPKLIWTTVNLGTSGTSLAVFRSARLRFWWVKMVSHRFHFSNVLRESSIFSAILLPYSPFPSLRSFCHGRDKWICAAPVGGPQGFALGPPPTWRILQNPICNVPPLHMRSLQNAHVCKLWAEIQVGAVLSFTVSVLFSTATSQQPNSMAPNNAHVLCLRRTFSVNMCNPLAGPEDWHWTPFSSWRILQKWKKKNDLRPRWQGTKAGWYMHGVLISNMVSLLGNLVNPCWMVAKCCCRVTWSLLFCCPGQPACGPSSSMFRLDKQGDMA